MIFNLTILVTAKRFFFFKKKIMYLSQRWVHIKKECPIYIPTAHFTEVCFIPTESQIFFLEFCLKLNKL